MLAGGQCLVLGWLEELPFEHQASLIEVSRSDGTDFASRKGKGDFGICRLSGLLSDCSRHCTRLVP